MLTPSQIHQFIDTLRVVVLSMDKNGYIRYVSNASVELLGYNSKELEGKSILDRVVQEDQDKTIHYIHQLVAGVTVSDFDNRVYRKDGAIVPLAWSGRWNRNEQLLYVALRDITVQHQLTSLKDKYEQELRQRNLEMFDMLERVSDGFFSLDKEWRFIYGNAQLENMLNIKREDYFLRNYWDCFPEMINTPYYTYYHRAMQENVAVHFEAYFPPFDKWFSVDAYPSPTGLSVFFRDVSNKIQEEEQRKKYEQTIERQNKQLVNILERMDTGFVSLDHELRVQYFNNKAEEILGLPRAKVMGRKIIEWYSQESQDLYRPLYEIVLQKGEPLHCEHIYPESGRWLEVSIYPADDGISVFFKDIDERKKTEMKLRNLSLVAEETDNIVLLIDRDGKITWVNNAFTHITGYTFAEAFGQKASELLLGPESDSDTIRFIKEQFRKGKAFSVEIVNYTKEKKKIWVEMSSQPLFDDHARIERFFMIQRDITERKRMEQVLGEEKQKRQQSITAAAIAAQENERAQVGRELHDNVNQVLTTVKLYQELCLNGIGNQEELMTKSMSLLQSSIDEIRGLSKRLSAPSLGNIRLKDSLRELVETVIATNRISVSLDTSQIENLEVKEEVHLALYRIIQEQLTNVLKHAEAKNVNIELKVVDDNLTVKISDDGKGFDLNNKRIGIGIANMTTRAESLKGKLIINSAVGLGCVLLVQIPLQV
jgi:PAS domain S-box-containing protein